MERPIDNRAEILALLAGGPASTGQLSAARGITRQAVHHHLVALRSENLVRQVGKGRAARWELTWPHGFEWPLPPEEGVGEDAMWRHARDVLGPELATVGVDTMACLDYGVTEMLNNAIDHSRGSRATVQIDVGEDVVVAVADDGIGAFRHVREHFGLPDDLDAIAHIAKGRQTTAPDRHTGQGLFFTSRVVDRFQLEANGHVWKVDSTRDDTTVGPGADRAGTRVVLRTAAAGTRRPKDVFDAFSEPDDLRFDRTSIRVALADHGTGFVSRSEAKRLAAGLEGYDAVELDFRGVREVGQGFVDELFRVWATTHPGTRLTPRNMSDEVAFMVERGLPRR